MLRYGLKRGQPQQSNISVIKGQNVLLQGQQLQGYGLSL